MFRLATKFRPETEAFERACAAGFRGAEFWLGTDVLVEWRSVLATARSFPLYYALHFPSDSQPEPLALRRITRLYQGLDCTALVIHQADFEAYSSALQASCPDMNLAVENHALDLPGFRSWEKDSPALTLDVEHLWKYTLGDSSLEVLLSFLQRFLQESGHKLRHVHLPGYHPGHPEHHPLHHSPTMAAEVFSLLADYGFAGLIVSEADAPFQNAADLSRDVAVYRKWWDCYSLPQTPTMPVVLPAFAEPVPVEH